MAQDPAGGESGTRSDGPDLRDRLDYDDGKLLAECEIHTFRASGPGGQKRNKTSSAVRLHHRPSGLIVKAAESRSQHENKARALRRLREALAVHYRRALPARLAWPDNVQIVEGALRLRPHHPATHQIIALLLDAVAACAGDASAAAECLGISPSSLTRVLRAHHAAYAEAARIRQAAGRPAGRQKL